MISRPPTLSKRVLTTDQKQMIIRDIFEQLDHLQFSINFLGVWVGYEFNTDARCKVRRQVCEKLKSLAIRRHPLGMDVATSGCKLDTSGYELNTSG